MDENVIYSSACYISLYPTACVSVTLKQFHLGNRFQTSQMTKNVKVAYDRKHPNTELNMTF